MFGVRVGVGVGGKGSSPSCSVKPVRCVFVYGAVHVLFMVQPTIMHWINSRFNLFYIFAFNARTDCAWKWNASG